jgi:hypothetical protein
MSRAILRPAVLCVLVCLLAVSFVSASPARRDQGVREAAGFGPVFRTVLPELWSSLRNLFLEEGSSLDPDGKPQSAVITDPAAYTDEGSKLDPNG